MTRSLAEPIRIGLIGAGSMGALHARVIAGSDLARLIWVADTALDRATVVAGRFETRALAAADLETVDAVVIAAPTAVHAELARPVIAAGIPLLLEKPLGGDYDESAELVDLARHAGSVLMCGLLERFNPAVRTALDIVRDPVHATTTRHSPYAERIVTGVGDDLLIHDVDIVLRLFGGLPTWTSGVGSVVDARTSPGNEDIVEATIRFAGGGVAALSASRVSQRKVRSLSIAELDRLIEVDLLRQDVTVHRHVQSAEFDEEAGYRQQTIIEIPMIRHGGEPLQLQLQHFVSIVRGEIDRDAELASILAPHAVVRDVLESVRSVDRQ